MGIHLTYRLSRRQRLISHLGTWLLYWPGLLLMLGITAVCVALAVLKSIYFLLILLLPPMMNNLPRFFGGLAGSLCTSSQPMDVVIEEGEGRIGYLWRGERHWLPVAEIERIERFGDVWAILGSGPVIDIPVAAISEECIARLRVRSEQG